MRDPWLKLEMEGVPQTSVKACRILVCGRTGVGKSTLINKVFGVPMTIESHMKQGDHDINEAFESDTHPGIIIHDSRGFQAGDAKEVGQFERFIKKRSVIDDPKESAGAVFVSTVSTPTISRMLCDNILRCFGFPKIDPASVNNIMNKIIGWNLKRFLTQQVGHWGLASGSMAVVIVTAGAGTPLLAGLSLLEASSAARIIVKCTCDLILILDRAFKHGGKFVTGSDIELARREYVTTQAQGSWSKRKQVHAQVVRLIPVISKKFWNAVRISNIKVGMEEIIQNNRWSPSAMIGRTDSVQGSLVTKLSAESLRDEEEMTNLFELAKV
ncbi:unnamed protein product [Aureobasidium uvarum]|uniref:G domain-containing protein n=1 Tax=Aureobasidium uvarum TaxID=2773716 RepID=A0A9N8KW96_9PEZI|nr:unnamed protein product [Aureobasidium uvarum]